MTLGLTLTPLPAFDDNYLWLLDNGREALVVDPGDAAPVAAALDARGLTLAGILLTHHHGDHVGGVDALRPRLQGPVYAPAGERMPEPVQRAATWIRGGDTVDLLGVSFAVMDVPGHTAGHIAYFAAEAGSLGPLLFCGDTLFSAGCGRLFEGTAAQMYESLNLTLGALPDDTRIYCGHEYTVNNLRFAESLEPSNPEIAKKLAWAKALREKGQPTLPSTMREERLTNPFLRVAEKDVVAKVNERLAQDHSPQAVLAAVRAMKDAF